jgi:hypothetical protein
VEAVKELNSTVEELNRKTEEHSTRLDQVETHRLEESPNGTAIVDIGVPSKRQRVLRSANVDLALALVLQQAARQIRISLVGLGGIGKSTLARQLIDEDVVRTQFENRVIYMILSPAANPDTAIKQLYGLLELPSIYGEMDTAVMQQRIRDRIRPQPVLIILDNVWDRCVVSKVIECGFQGVIVTTRLENICPDLKDLLVKPFDYGMALNFFSQEDASSSDVEDSKALREIIHRCGGLPLALDVISRLRKSSRSPSLPAIARNLSSCINSDPKPLNGAFDMSLNNLEAATRRRLYTFALLPKGPVNIAHLAVCWGEITLAEYVENCKTRLEDLIVPGTDLDTMAQNSLISLSSHHFAQVHDLFHDYLRDHLSGSFAVSCF